MNPQPASQILWAPFPVSFFRCALCRLPLLGQCHPGALACLVPPLLFKTGSQPNRCRMSAKAWVGSSPRSRCGKANDLHLGGKARFTPGANGDRVMLWRLQRIMNCDQISGGAFATDGTSPRNGFHAHGSGSDRREHSMQPQALARG